jgi:hypothetical protein
MLAADAETDMELQPETASFRKAQLMRWQTIRDTFAESQDAKPDLGELRVFLSTLLTSAPVAAVAQFVASNQEWRQGDGRLLRCYEAGVGLIQCVYPRPTWSKTPALASDVAADHQVWGQWIRDWSAEFSATEPAAALALNGQAGTWASLLRMKGEAMLDKKNVLLTALSIGQMAYQVYLGVEKHRQDRIASGESAPSPMTLEAVMEAAQCQIPNLKNALATLMGDEEQSSQCVDAIVGNPDLAAILGTLSGLRTTTPRPACAPRRQSPAAAAPSPPPPPTPSMPPVAGPAPPATNPQPAEARPRPSLSEYRADFLSRSHAAPQSMDWASALLTRRVGPPARAAEPTATPSDKPEPPGESPLDPHATAPAPAVDARAPASISNGPPVTQRLAELEHWVLERSRVARARGDKLAAQLDGFLVAAELSLQEEPAPDFEDPADTAEALAAATRIQPTHFSTGDDLARDSDIAALIEQTKKRLERRYELDDQFLAWLEERFEAIQSASARRSLDQSSSAA